MHGRAGCIIGTRGGPSIIEKSLSGQKVRAAGAPNAASQKEHSRDMKIPKVRRSLYRAAAKLGDVEALASGKPERIIERAENKVIWRGFSSLFRAFRGR